MFDNIGRKIKNATKYIFYSEVIFSIISGIIFIIAKFGEEDFVVVVGLVLAVGGSFAAWISALVFYALGEIAENTAICAGKMSLDKVAEYKNAPKTTKASSILTQLHTMVTNNAQQVYPTNSVWMPPPTTVETVGADKVKINCPHCNSELNYSKDEFVTGRKFACAFCQGKINADDFIL